MHAAHTNALPPYLSVPPAHLQRECGEAFHFAGVADHFSPMVILDVIDQVSPFLKEQIDDSQSNSVSSQQPRTARLDSPSTISVDVYCSLLRELAYSLRLEGKTLKEFRPEGVLVPTEDCGIHLSTDEVYMLDTLTPIGNLSIELERMMKETRLRFLDRRVDPADGYLLSCKAMTWLCRDNGSLSMGGYLQDETIQPKQDASKNEEVEMSIEKWLKHYYLMNEEGRKKTGSGKLAAATEISVMKEYLDAAQFLILNRYHIWAIAPTFKALVIAASLSKFNPGSTHHDSHIEHLVIDDVTQLISEAALRSVFKEYQK